MNEQWLDIKGYEGYFQISNFGRVKSLARTIMRSNGCRQTFRERILKIHTNNNGYKQVTLWKEGKGERFGIHRLVYLTFNNLDYKFKGYNTKTLIMHIDDNPSNNNLDNLKIGTQKDNINDCLNKGRFARGEKHGQRKLKEFQVKRIKLMLEVGGITQKKIGKLFGVLQDTISRIKNGKRWGHIL